MGASPAADLAESIAGRDLLDHEAVERALSRSGPTGARRKYLVLRRRAREIGNKVLWRALRIVERGPSRHRVECPICGWTGLAYRPFVAPGYVSWNQICPSCFAAARHRLFAVAWSRWSRLPRIGNCVYLAPEACLLPMISAGRSVITADLSRADIDMCADLEHLPIGSGSVDLLVCSDVLEHVFDDRAALREIARVLSRDGVALVHVPIMVDRTVDYRRAIEVDYGHVRAYGTDLLDRFVDAGLSVEVVGTAQLDREAIRSAGLLPDAVFALTVP